MKKTNYCSGFTAIELLVTVAVLGVVVAYAVPSFKQMILNNRLASQTNEIAGLLGFARSEASKRLGSTITLCPTSDNAACSGTDWSSGWLIMLDLDGDRTVDTDDQILRVAGSLSNGLTLQARGFSSGSATAAASYVQFSGNGQPMAAGGLGASAGTFVICDERGDSFARGIVVMVSGQQRMARDETDPADGIVDLHNAGGNVTCP